MNCDSPIQGTNPVIHALRLIYLFASIPTVQQCLFLLMLTCVFALFLNLKIGVDRIFTVGFTYSHRIVIVPCSFFPAVNQRV